MAIFSSKLRKASYNGVSFDVTQGSLTFGRRTVVHEYPMRDNPYTEDLGRSARQFSITGFVVGSDYVSKAKKLIATCEKPTSTEVPGKLVHPWLGTLNVVMTETPTVQWDLNKRLATFTLNFVEILKQENPSKSTSWGDKLRSQVDSFIDSALGAFGKTMDNIENYTTFIDNIANGNFQDILGSLSDSKVSKVFDLVDSIIHLETTAVNLLSQSPSTFGKGVLDALGVGGYVNSVRDWSRATKSTITTLSSPSLSSKTKRIVEGSTTYESDKTRADRAVETLVRQILLADAIGSASIIGTNNDNPNSDEEIDAYSFSNREDTDTLTIRNELLVLLETEMIYTQDNESELYEPLSDLYATTYQYLTNDVVGSKILELEIKEPTSSLVLAYDFYGDASRADEIAKRNGIVNGSFIPTTTIKLSST
ncbi:MAG: DNA circularization protein [Succinivibrio sp.]